VRRASAALYGAVLEEGFDEGVEPDSRGGCAPKIKSNVLFVWNAKGAAFQKKSH
jgi:hypothetical protein